MLRRLQLSGFKSFKSSSTIDLAPITLIYGSNSSGKSSVIQSLMLLRQSMDQLRDNRAPLVFRSKAFLDLGDFTNIISSHNQKKSLEITLGPGTGTFRSPRFLPNRSTDELFRKVSMRLMFALDARLGSRVTRIDLNTDNETKPLIRFTPSSMQPRNSAASDFVSFNTAEPTDQQFYELTGINQASSLLRSTFKAFMRELPEYVDRLRELEALGANSNTLTYDVAELAYRTAASQSQLTSLPQTQEAFRTLLTSRLKRYNDYTFNQYQEDVVALNRGQLMQLRTFLPVSAGNAAAEALPEVAVEQLAIKRFARGRQRRQKTLYGFPELGLLTEMVSSSLAAELNKLTYIGPLRDYPERNYIFSGLSSEVIGSRGENLPALLFSNARNIAHLNDYAEIMELGYKVSVHRAADPEIGEVFALRLTDNSTGIRVGLSDVGFGISQILPILLECASTKSSTLVIEQPEIHLNPRLQAAFGQVLADVISKTQKQRKQFIIETHSEHLLLRLQKLIRKGLLSRDDVAVYFVSRQEGWSSIRRLRLNEVGDMLDQWPDGFFDDLLRETLAD